MSETVIPMASTIPASYLGLRTAGTVIADWDPNAFELQMRRVQ